MEPEKKQLGTGEKHRPKPPLFLASILVFRGVTAKKEKLTYQPASNPSRFAVGRCISEPKWSLIYLHSFSQKGVRENSVGFFNEQWKEKNPGCFPQTSRWLHPDDQNGQPVEKNTWMAGTDYLNFPHYFNVLHLRGKNGKGKFLDLIPRLQDAGVNPSGDDGRHTGWGNRSKGKQHVWMFFLKDCYLQRFLSHEHELLLFFCCLSLYKDEEKLRCKWKVYVHQIPLNKNYFLSNNQSFCSEVSSTQKRLQTKE